MVFESCDNRGSCDRGSRDNDLSQDRESTQAKASFLLCIFCGGGFPANRSLHFFCFAFAMHSAALHFLLWLCNLLCTCIPPGLRVDFFCFADFRFCSFLSVLSLFFLCFLLSLGRWYSCYFLLALSR